MEGRFDYDERTILLLLQGAWGTLVMSLLTFAIGGLRDWPGHGAHLAGSPGAGGRAAWIQPHPGHAAAGADGLCFYGPDIAGIGSVPALLAATLAMPIYASAFLGEIWRGCIQAVHKSQWRPPNAWA